jgi:hypothetical protein
MTTVDLRSWAPAVPHSDTAEELYTGKHRKPGIRTLSVMRMAHRPRHRAH